jgi:hypothetical protein
MSSHKLHATEISNTFLHDSHRKPEPQATQNVQSQAASMPDGRARDSRDLWERLGR